MRRNIRNLVVVAIGFVGLRAFAAPLTGTFIDLADGSFNDTAQIASAVDTFHGMGMRTLIIAATAQKPKTVGCDQNIFQPSYLIPSDPKVEALGCSLTSQDPACLTRWDGLLSRVGKFLRAAQGKHMQVVIGLTLSMVACPDFASSQTNRYQVSYMNYVMASQMETHFRDRYGDTLAGYYIPDEVGAAHPVYQSFIATQVTAIRYASRRPIYNSPYLGISSQLGYSPKLIASWAKDFLRNTGVNVLLYQDSVGAFMQNMGGHPGEYTLEDYLAELVATVGPAAVYAVVELFNYGSPTSASFMRVNQQLWQSRMAGGRVAYISQGQMYPISVFGAHPGSPRLYNEYQAEYNGRGKRHGFQYRFIGNQPMSSHPDDKVKLRNTLVGGGRNANDAQWVGFAGEAYLELDLGSVKSVDFVSVDVLSDGGQIGFPSSAAIAFSANGTKWVSGRSMVTEPVARGKVGEYALSNSVPFGVKARLVRIYLFNSNPKTFLSEVTVTSR